ncbi:right-handed parallel beta-helix repeat-containing protein [Myxococcota bacterium]|nr:right-handed parallel beta-helix repeat-containing protein [Myxococcota bacterium]MBU1381053.1 right-handed parallel beta-helix repeat-containing protein [Myxococcota bacterium]MBU1495432.1 right-handed parallel beta-helix repeat-containing protein [Myxococcota bacterium]
MNSRMFIIVAVLVAIFSCSDNKNNNSNNDYNNLNNLHNWNNADYTYEITGTSWYVDINNGSDENPGTSELPFATIDYALTQVSGGDAVFVRDGSYGDLIFGSNNGLAIPEVFSDWVTLRADEGHSPVLAHVELGTWGQEDTTDAMPFTQVGNSNLRLRIDGFQITDRVRIRGSRYVEIRNCLVTSDDFSLEELTKEAGYGIQVFNGQHVLLLNNEITHCGIGVEAMTTDFVMKGNDIHHNSHDGLKIYGGENWLVEGNIFRELDDGLADDDDDPDERNMHVDGIHIHTIVHEGGYQADKWAGGAKNIVIRGNLFFHIEAMAVMINQNDSGRGDWEDFIWENNIFGPAGGHLFIQGSSFEGYFIFRHNTVLFTPNDVWTSMFGRTMRPGDLDNPQSACYYVQVWGNPANHMYYNNIFTSKTVLNQDQGVVTNNIFIGQDDLSNLPYQPISGTIEEFIVQGGVFGQLVEGSAAIDAGTTEQTVPEKDFYGTTRDATGDIGAVEFK